MSDDDFIDLFDPDTLEELRAEEEKISRENRRSIVDGKVDPQLTDYYLALGDVFHKVGVHMDIDLADEVIIVTTIGLPEKTFDVVPLSLINEFYAEKRNPVALALAITAGLVEPTSFRFWIDHE